MDREHSMNGRKEEFIQDLVGKRERIKQIGMPRRGWEYQINLDLREIGRDGTDLLIRLRIGASGSLL
jgi:hypothetical protein